MSKTLAHIWRHPIKGIGCEPLTAASLATDRPIPGDRAWAVLREDGDTADGWRKCRNFLRGARAPRLMAVDAVTTAQGLTLTHPDLAPLRFDPDTEADKLIAWVAPLWPEDQPKGTTLVRAPAEGMSDMPYPSISLIGHGSLTALSERAGRALDMRRFRCNLWINGLAPFEEFELVGKRIAIGSAVLDVVERNERCRATEANPDTGLRDVDTLKLLRDSYGHQDFGVYARVITPGEIAVGDDMAVL